MVQDHHLIGSDEKNIQTHFDSNSGENYPAGASPMSIMLQALPACSAMDVIDIVRKKRKTVTGLTMSAEAERAEEHPRVFTKVRMHYNLSSPDATEQDVQRAIELSQDKYCSVSGMFKKSGCEIEWSFEITRP